MSQAHDPKQESVEVLKTDIDKLKAESKFYQASKLLQYARIRLQKNQPAGTDYTDEKWWQAESAKDEVWIVQQLALCTYKNEEIPARKRLDQAMALLEEIGLRNRSNKNTETLCLGGATHKYKWQQFGQAEDLQESLSFYLSAFERDPQQDMGYGGINAAFILDLLADRASRIACRSGTSTDEAEHLKKQASALRQQIIEKVPAWLEGDQSFTGEQRFWHQLTLAEAHFGLGDYEQANEWLQNADVAQADEWKRRTVFMQLRALADLQGIAPPHESGNPDDWHPAWKTLAIVTGKNDAPHALDSGSGKTGLALSGGGFRASFFHLGVLARLAEMDALRGIEAISTVSGGSILGAHYYLEVQNLLQSKADRNITREDYIGIVRRVQKNFLQGVQTNIKMQTFASLKDNWDFLSRSKDYSRSHRLGEFYESKLYRKIGENNENGSSRTMPQLAFTPAGVENAASFKPKFSNWVRRAKAPTIILNATSLNSGHNWQFTAHSMGEPPSHILGEIDSNSRHRRVYYHDAPTEALKNYRLGYAVAASASVPGIFEPVSVAGLYENRTIRLVDGGVHDNQGVAGLLSEGCTRILCSDACGQMEDIVQPSDTPTGVLFRTTSILQDRVRETEYQDLRCRLDSHALDGLFFVHTRKELEPQPLDWINCPDSQPAIPENCPQTSYGIDRELQEKIAAMRTDLDAFTEVEAYALMASGYQITKREFELLQQQHCKEGRPGTWGNYDINAAGVDWPFRPLEPVMALKRETNKQSQDLHYQLKIAGEAFSKAWHLIPAYKLMVMLAGAAAVIGLGAFATLTWNIEISFGAIFFLVLLSIIALSVPVLHWLMPASRFRFIFKTGITLLGFIVAKIHLDYVNEKFLDRGRLERLLKL
ncbi:MAG: patatin-like phospholipase family protein [Betaproteobacteria bacterium]|nr:patatin-like phospholipase family protein [Betaproteobacteria bacterium]